MPPPDHAPTSSPHVRAEPGDERHADVAARLAEVRRRIGEAADRAGRPSGTVSLVAVSKTFDVAAIEAARSAGQADFGEARAQELKAKAKDLGPGVRWHFVGRLQRNKVKDVVGRAGLIHAVDRWDLAEAVSRRAEHRSRVQEVLVQVNVGEDPAKGGCAVGEALDLLSRVRLLPGVACRGLMTIPPFDVDPRPLYRRLRELRDEAQARFPEVAHLSMGMTGDFEVAVEEGATIVRVGEAVFGRRDRPGDVEPGSRRGASTKE